MIWKMFVTNSLLLNPHISRAGRRLKVKVGRQGEKYHRQDVTTATYMLLCMARLQ